MGVIRLVVQVQICGQGHGRPVYFHDIAHVLNAQSAEDTPRFVHIARLKAEYGIQPGIKAAFFSGE